MRSGSLTNIRMRLRAAVLRQVAVVISLGFVLGGFLQAQSLDLPRIENTAGKYSLIVDGKPFYILGAQVHNSSGWPSSLQAAWPTLVAVHCNTVMIPVSWEAIEPQPGRFDYAAVDDAINGARTHGLHVVLLWFGTWKNGAMTYVPEWVKTHPTQYPKMLNAFQQPVDALNPAAEATRTADSRAFASLLSHIRETDGTIHTVIMVQVENEAGVLGTDRDYSDASTRLFQSAVPADVTRAMGYPTRGRDKSWLDAFGVHAPEAFTSYLTAKYIEAVAAAGKAAYDLPIYVNVWPREQPGLLRPGFSSPSGGAVSYLLDLWKATAHHIDVIGPDSYDTNAEIYRSILASYNRPDNPLLVPETGGTLAHAKNMFYAFAADNSIGISTFGVDGSRSPESVQQIDKPFGEITANYGLFSPNLAEWMRLRQAGETQVAVEAEGLANPALSFSQFDAAVRFGPVQDGYGGPRGQGNPSLSGRILVGQLAEDEFLLAGMNASVVFAPKLGSPYLNTMYLSVEEGSYEEGTWHRKRLLNGDETAFGLVFPPQGQTLKVKVLAY